MPDSPSSPAALALPSRAGHSDSRFATRRRLSSRKRGACRSPRWGCRPPQRTPSTPIRTFRRPTRQSSSRH
jgi:hypothetical protein